MNPGPQSVHNPEIWRDGIELVKAIYRLTRHWPKEEMYGLSAQIRRAAVPIPANLAEGVGRASAGEVHRFATIALGSAYEVETLLVIAAELELSSSSEVDALRVQLAALSRRISSFVRCQEGKR